MTQRRVRDIVGAVTLSIAVILLAFGLAEIALRGIFRLRNAFVDAVPLPYVLDDDYGPAPPWADATRVLERDDVLLWRSRGGVKRRYVDVFTPAHTNAERTAILRRFRPSVPESLRNNPTWTIALNSQGFRTSEFGGPKRPPPLRVVCLGDSWTFGANVDQDQAYPQRLQALLREAFPAADVEVLNLGVFGYSSFQGLQLLRRHTASLAPDVVVIGFAMNDGRVAGFRDADVARMAEPSLVKRIGAVAAESQVVRLAQYLLLSVLHQPKAMADQIRAADARIAPRPWQEPYEGMEAWTRVPLAEYERNLTEMVVLARRAGAAVVLMFNEVSRESPYRAALQRVARELRVPLVDSAALIARARHEAEGAMERALGLSLPSITIPAVGEDVVRVVFRVSANGVHVARALSVVGAHPALGDLVPNRVVMHDDGTHGDQRAGDGVWSYAATFAAGTRLSYVYTNSGGEGRWEGLDVPAVRTLAIDGPGGRTVYRPIESFGKLALQADAWHTDAAGYELMARAVFDALVRNERLRQRLAEPRRVSRTLPRPGPTRRR